MLTDINPTILILTEHGLPEKCLENTKLTEYNLIAHFSRTNYTYGGIAIYINNNIEIETEEIDTSKHCQELVCELSIIHIKAKNSTLS